MSVKLSVFGQSKPIECSSKRGVETNDETETSYVSVPSLTN